MVLTVKLCNVPVNTGGILSPYKTNRGGKLLQRSRFLNGLFIFTMQQTNNINNFQKRPVVLVKSEKQGVCRIKNIDRNIHSQIIKTLILKRCRVQAIPSKKGNTGCNTQVCNSKVSRTKTHTEGEVMETLRLCLVDAWGSKTIKDF